MENVTRVSDRVDVVRCRVCEYWNDMSDVGKSSYCELHSIYHVNGEEHLFYTGPDGYCSGAIKKRSKNGNFSRRNQWKD
ncbi:MAG: hypothetical protein J6W84_03385 [Bacteroidales bacterium]|nr:hypothetical protein [Bacteroidales bacterium]